MTIADRLRLAGRKIHDASASEREAVLNAGLAEVMTWPFGVSPGRLTDLDGITTDRFACVVHSAENVVPEEGDIPADNAAAVIDLIEDMGPAQLQSAYFRVLKAKQLRKTPIPETN